jgi:ribonucleoside-diphosphate reductase alpha chain
MEERKNGRYKSYISDLSLTKGDLMDNYQRFIHVSRYARYIPELKSRENWDETVTRLTDFIKKHQPKLGKDIDRIHDAVLKLEVMPSMRLL